MIINSWDPLRHFWNGLHQISGSALLQVYACMNVRTWKHWDTQKYHRGDWWPFCKRISLEIDRKLAPLRAAGGEAIMVTAQASEITKSTKERWGLKDEKLQVVSDFDKTIANEFKLTITPWAIISVSHYSKMYMKILTEQVRQPNTRIRKWPNQRSSFWTQSSRSSISGKRMLTVLSDGHSPPPLFLSLSPRLRRLRKVRLCKRFPRRRQQMFQPRA